jgi:hypothetical protein
MKYSEVLNRYVNTGLQIPEEQYNLLSPSLRKSYMRMRGVVGYEGWELKLLSEDEKITFIDTKGKGLDSIKIKYLLKYSENKDIIATKIIESKGEQLNYHDIEHLLEYSNDKDLIATKFIEAKSEELYYKIIHNLLQYSKDKDDIATKIIEAKGQQLDYYDIRDLLKYSENKDFIATKIIQVKRVELNEWNIGVFLYFSNDKELIKKLLLQKGVDYKLINKVIIDNFEIDTPLIPDNYQEMLNEIRRIKQIMG